MNRRAFLMTIAATLIPSLHGIPYHAPDYSGTWLGIERSTYPRFSSMMWIHPVSVMELNKGPI